jgi:RNA polymerase sigma-70 factor (ECF subfamily)
MQDERQQLVQSLLETLPPDYRQAVVLHYWHDMPYQQIADVMDTTVSAVKSRLFRARRKLAEAGADVGLSPATEETAVPG